MQVPHDSVHRVDRLHDRLAGIGLHATRRAITIALTADERARASVARRVWFGDVEAPRVGINPGARGDKRWPVTRFESLIEALAREGRRVVVFVGHEELDTLGRLRAMDARNVRIDTASEPREFAARLGACAVFVTDDTGPMHLAAAVGMPTVSIFTKGNAALYAPQGPAHLALQDVGDGIAVERVLAAVVQLGGLRERREPPVPSPSGGAG